MFQFAILFFKQVKENDGIKMVSWSGLQPFFGLEINSHVFALRY